MILACEGDSLVMVTGGSQTMVRGGLLQRAWGAGIPDRDPVGECALNPDAHICGGTRPVDLLAFAHVV